MPRILFRSADVVFPDAVRRSSVLVEDGKIVDVDAAETATADRVIDCAGLHLLPGVIDDQVHFREPGLTHKEDLAHASRAGGLFCLQRLVAGFQHLLEQPQVRVPDPRAAV